ncbi:hypothetical protein AMELA_G00287310 [Ameiurus melas]|uniref:Uncharacterized protein n=1 Tax=Ameiurus melas TaxID=219545 RepID=A0A7J5ZIW6_AMEME|nr:hypothetical protein AMELA_G00287310 [Ameiurus melas]
MHTISTLVSDENESNPLRIARADPVDILITTRHDTLEELSGTSTKFIPGLPRALAWISFPASAGLLVVSHPLHSSPLLDPRILQQSQ